MSTAYDTPKGRSNFLPPACAVCGDSGERIIETPTSIGLLRETVPCDQCATGRLLVCWLTEAMTHTEQVHPMTENDRG